MSKTGDNSIPVRRNHNSASNLHITLPGALESFENTSHSPEVNAGAKFSFLNREAKASGMLPMNVSINGGTEGTTFAIIPAMVQNAIGHLMETLLELEAGFLCAGPHGHVEKRPNYRAGYYVRQLRTRMGVLTIRVPHLRYLHPRVSMLKRYRRVEETVIEALLINNQETTGDQWVRRIIQTLWTLELTQTQLDFMARTIKEVLKNRRSIPFMRTAATARSATPVGTRSYGPDFRSVSFPDSAILPVAELQSPSPSHVFPDGSKFKTSCHATTDGRPKPQEYAVY